MAVCCVCAKDEAAYKCPQCISPYCSVACYKRHKATCETKCGADEPASTSTTVGTTSEERLTPLQQRVLASSEVASLLADVKMQQKVSDILEAPNAAATLREALQEDPEGVGKIAHIIYRLMEQTPP